MELETTIAEALRITDGEAEYDEACKTLLSEKILLSWIMKSCLEEYKDCTIEEIAEKYIEGQPQVSEVHVLPDETNASGRIRGSNSEDFSLTEGTFLYDIRFTAIAPGSGKTIRLIVNLEAQSRYNPGYPLLKRAIYYCCRMISSQYGREFVHSHFENVCKVYSIWLCTHPPVELRNTITRYHMTEENLFGCVKEDVQNYDLLTVIMICLGDSNREDTAQILRLLNVLFSTELKLNARKQILQDEFSIQMTQKLEEEMRYMCNLSQGVKEQGIEIGRAEGRVEGRAEGRAEGTLSAIKNLIAETGWPIERAMAILKIPESEQKMYRDLLKS